MSDYRTEDVPVRGGMLRVGCWQSGEPERVVLAIHGITSTHLAWPLVAERLTDTLVLAPDLRGRGRSADLPGPWGMAQHADDLAAVLTALAPGRRAVLAGHSMGGFVAVALATAYPELAGSVVLVDGGIPLVLPDGWELAEAARVGLGPAAARLEQTFPDRAAYQAFWREHPAFAGQFSDAVAAYVDYDLRPDGPPWRSSCQPEAMFADHAEQFTGGPVDHAWPSLTAPVSLLRAPRGLQDEPGGLYTEAALDRWHDEHPAFHWQNVDGVNHYTITLGEAGAAAVSAAIAEQRPAAPQLRAPAG
ncbi:MAG TPA: alpha/beta hydrolase [Jatrophihabitans sp.]|nr:alpha/beta hydrolase [Jatrophihabitans sp.]